MNKREIPAALRRAAEQLPMPHSQDLWEMPVSKQTELDYITAQELPQVPIRRRAFLPALTCCIVLLFFGWFWQYRMVETTVFLDVNPSIQITANRRDRVLEVTGLNADGRSLIEGRVFSGLPLPTVLGQLADTLAQRDYLTPEKSTVLLTVQGRRQSHVQELESLLSSSIQSALEPRKIAPAIILQTYEEDASLQQAASQQQVSPGKMQYIRQILEEEDDYSLEELASMSLEDLRRLAQKEAGDDWEEDDDLEEEDREDWDSEDQEDDWHASQSEKDTDDGGQEDEDSDRSDDLEEEDDPDEEIPSGEDDGEEDEDPDDSEEGDDN